jgi:hypothetical protein
MTSHWQGDRTQTTVWQIANNNPFGNRQRENQRISAVEDLLSQC